MIKYKLREVANDLGVTAKEVIEVLSKYVGGVPKKQVTILTDEELNIVFDYFTQKNSVDSFEKYYATANAEVSSMPVDEEKNTEKETHSEKPSQVKKNDGKAANKTGSDNKRPSKNSADSKQGSKPQNIRTKENTQPEKNVKAENTQPSENSQYADSDSGETVFRNKRERKVVDTRQIVVDVERYNEKYDRLASEKIKSENQTAHKQGNHRACGHRNPLLSTAPLRAVRRPSRAASAPLRPSIHDTRPAGASPAGRAPSPCA